MAANVRSLDEIEALLVVRFPAAFRRAFVAGRRPRPDSRYLLLDLDEIDLAEAWEIPAEAVVVARSLAGGVVGFEILVDATGAVPPAGAMSSSGLARYVVFEVVSRLLAISSGNELLAS